MLVASIFETIDRAAWLAAGLLLFTACPEKENETDGSTEATSGGPSTSTTEAPTTTGGPTSNVTETGTMGGTDAASTTGSMTAGTASTSIGETEGTTGGALPPELDAACQSACDNYFACLQSPPFPNVEACKFACIESVWNEPPMCIQASAAFNFCLGEMSCSELVDAFENEQFGLCADEFAATQSDCPSCEGFSSEGPPNVCSLGQMCTDQSKQEFACDGDTCTCLVDDRWQGDCPAIPGLCDDQDALVAAAAECCGFQF